MHAVRQNWKKFMFLLAIFIAAVAISAGIPLSHAGTILLKEEAAETIDAVRGEAFPESRFGHAPQRVNLHTNKGFASQATEEIDANQDREVSAPKLTDYSRKLASRGASGGSEVYDTATFSNTATTRITGKGIQEVALIASDLGFFPKTVFVSRDVPVRMFVTGSSKNTLCIMMDSFQIRKQVRSQKIEEISFTPSLPGKYRFYCPVNGMEGSLVVKDLAATHEGA